MDTRCCMLMLNINQGLAFVLFVMSQIMMPVWVRCTVPEVQQRYFECKQNMHIFHNTKAFSFLQTISFVWKIRQNLVPPKTRMIKSFKRVS